MTKRALYPPNVRVRSSTLKYDADATAEELRQLGTDAFPGGGRLTGLRITVNGTDDFIESVSAGTARAPNGEAIVIESATPNLVLRDTANGAANWVCAVYREVAGTPLPTTTGQTAPNTEVTTASDVIVLTDAELTALPATTGTNHVANALDRLVVLGGVEAAGSGNPIPVANVSQDPLSSELRGISNSLADIPGMLITNVSDNAPTGTLTVEYVPTTGLARIQFPAGGYGTASSDLRDTATSVTLYGGGSNQAYYVSFDIIPELLPTTGATITTTVTVNAPFVAAAGDIHVASAVDAMLRAMKGTAVRTEENGLGIGLADNYSMSSILPGLLALGSALLSTAGDADLPRLLLQTSSTQSNTCVFQFPVVTGTQDRVFVRGYKIGGAAALTLNARYPNGGTTWYRDDGGTYPSLRLLLAANGEISLAQATAGASWSNSTDWNVISTWNVASAGALLQLGAGYLGATTATQPRIETTAADTTNRRTLIWKSTESGTNRTMNVYRVGGANGLEFVFNAEYTNGAGSPWSLIDSAEGAMCVTVTGPTSLAVFSQVALAADWTNWPTIAVQYAAGQWGFVGDVTFNDDVDISGNLNITGNLDYAGVLNGGAVTEYRVNWMPTNAIAIRTDDVADSRVAIPDDANTNYTPAVYTDQSGTGNDAAVQAFSGEAHFDSNTSPLKSFALFAEATGDDAEFLIPFPPLPDNVRLRSFSLVGDFTNGGGTFDVCVYKGAVATGTVTALSSTPASPYSLPTGTGTTRTLTFADNSSSDISFGASPNVFAHIRKEDASGFAIYTFSCTYVFN